MKLPKEESIHYPILLFVVMLGLAGRVHPEIIIGMGRNGIWIIFPCLLVTLFGVWLTLKIRSTDGYSLVHAVEQIGFSVFGRFVYALYALLFLGLTGYFCFLSGDFIARILLNGQPRNYIMLEVALTILCAFFPIKAFARYAHVLMIFAVPFYILICISPLLKVEWNWVMPILNTREMVDPMKSLATAMITFTPLAAIGLMRKDKEEINGWSIAIFSTIIAVFIAFLLTMAVATFGIVRAKEIIYLSYSTINAVRIENFVLERIEFIWVLYWKFIVLMSSAFSLRCACRALAGVMGIRLNWICILAGGLVAGIGILIVSGPFQFWMYSIILGYYSMFMVCFFPLIIYLIIRIKGVLS